MKTWMLVALFLLAAMATVGLLLPRKIHPIRPPALPALKHPAAPKPNVILISMDTTRPDHLGLYGYKKNTSPNVDRYFSSGGNSVIFKDARTQAPWTLPSHMALFTSMLPSHNGVDNINEVLSEEIPTLAQVLREGGYHTAALVNNGQMKAHWGFSKGFDEWREFEVDTQESNCENITSEALKWLEGKSAKPQAGAGPFFLFLHYYDAHDPYAAPEAFANAMGTHLSGDEARAIVEEYRDPSKNIENPALKADLIAAYDAELAWVDSQLGRLFEHVPPNTVVVLFSDHGEAFEEHGWTLHGATVYEEEVRVVLAMKGISAKPQALRVAEPVMLLDVAPTILAACGVRPPATFEGMDLSPLWTGKIFPTRLIPSETKAVLEGRISRGVVLEPWKAVYSLFDGKFELYKLPDETNDLSKKEPAAADALFKNIRQWMGEEEYWILYAHGSGDFEATITNPAGPFALFMPIGLDQERDNLDTADNGQSIHWITYPKAAPGSTKALFFQLPRSGSPVKFDLKINGSAEPAQVFVGPKLTHPAQLPVEITLDHETLKPVIEQPFAPTEPGFYILHFRGINAASRPSRVEKLDEQTIQQLRSLGYVR